MVVTEMRDADAVDQAPVLQPGKVASDEVAVPSPADVRITRRAHVVLGLLVAVISVWLLYRSQTELAFYGSSGEPGPGYLPTLLAVCLIGLGLALAAVWAFGPRARRGDVPALSLDPRDIGRGMLVWLALVVCAFLIEPLGFLLAGEVFVLLIIVVIERMRSIPMIVSVLLLPPAMYVLFAVLLDVQLPEGSLWL
jgi:membrane protease YdiL (CAAX protease family)